MSEPTVDDQPFVPSGSPNPLPAGKAFQSDPQKWYYLEAHYTNDNGDPVEGYASAVGQNAAESFWDYVIFNSGGSPGGSALEFQLEEPDDQGWSRWNIRDNAFNSGYRLSCKATGWLYRASAYDVKFRIVDHKLYCNYRWDGPVGSRYQSFLVSSGQYLGMDLPEFTCELVEVN